MESRDIYKDIETRTDGDIYIGVVGPVRSGKSTFIKKFMETLVIPNIESEFRKERATDELPQSAAGRTIMTTEPKFIPEEAVQVTVGGNATLNVRMIDCVGYIIPSSLGYIENEMPRMVMTPWFENEVPFNMAAEVGTQKVINEHSTIGLVITTDGSITDIPREEYQEAEERVIAELKQIKKPFVVLLNTIDPLAAEAKAMAEAISERHNVPVMPINCLDVDEDVIKEVMTKILFEFPVKEIGINMPRWVTTLEKEHWLRSSLYATIKNAAKNILHIWDANSIADSISENEYVDKSRIDNIDLGRGDIKVSVNLNPDLFYKVLGETTGLQIAGEADLMPCMIELAKMKKEYEKIKGALAEVTATGYGIVMPTLEELSLEEPEIVKQGGKYGVRLKASAPSIHIGGIKQKYKLPPKERQSKHTELCVYLQREIIYSSIARKSGYTIKSVTAFFICILFMPPFSFFQQTPTPPPTMPSTPT